MTTHEIELKALMLASLDGDAAAHRALLERLSSRLRAYYKGKLASVGRGAAAGREDHPRRVGAVDQRARCFLKVAVALSL